MAYRLTAADASVPTRLGSSGWWRTHMPARVGTCITDRLLLDEGLSLVYVDYLAHDDVLETSVLEREGRCLTLTIALQGQSSTLDSRGQRFDFVAGHSTMAAFASVRGERRFPAHQAVRQLRLIAEAPVLQRYGLLGLLDDAGHDQGACVVRFGKSSGAVQCLADSLIHLHHHAGSLLDTQIAALGLLAEQARACTPQPLASATPWPRHPEKIQQARDLLASHYDRPLTVNYLCAAVGTNEFTLKEGFRALYGTSPHRMLTAIRMQKAWALLEQGLRVSTVADRVGYRHLSSFSAAFARYHGRTPTSVARQSG